MFNFNWFRPKEKYPTWADIPPLDQLPDPTTYPPMPEVTPPKEEKKSTVYYRLGITDDNRVSFQMGYTEITLNAVGVDQMIKQLEVFRDQLDAEDAE